MRQIGGHVITQIVRSRHNGASYKEIAKGLGISVATSHKYAKNVRVPRAGLRKLRRKLIERQKLFELEYAAPNDAIVGQKLTTAKVRIIAHCLFDGSVVKGDYVIKYTNASLELVKQFINDMHSVYGVRPSDIFVNSGKNHPWWEVRFHSKRIVGDLSRYSQTYSTSDDVGLPKGIRGKREFTCAFLRAFWEDEGCISFDGVLTSSSKSRRLAREILVLHNKLGITCSTYKSGVCHVIRIKKTLENYLRFQERIGFGESVITRGKLICLKKSEVLSDFLYTHRFQKQST